jgi:hypothetical protein
MATIGRNEPCSCGSGLKHKKCCLEKITPAAATTHPAPRSNSELAKALDLPSGMQQFTAYAIAKMTEDPLSAGDNEQLRRLIQKGLRERWTIKKVAAMSTDAIEAQLTAYGVAHSAVRFMSLAEGRTSAWSISDSWLEYDAVTCRGSDQDFLGFAACELWKRYLPERPSIEVLDDWMQDGYTLVEQRRAPEACDLWLKLWDALRPRFSPSMTTMSATEPVFRGVQSVFNWSQDFESELINASLADLRYAVIGRRYCSEWIAQFPDESELTQVNFRRSLASHLHRLGESAAAGQLLHELIERWPNNVWGYVALADAYSHFFRTEQIFPLDLRRAETYLRQALTLRELRAYDREVLEERLVVLSNQQPSAGDGFTLSSNPDSKAADASLSAR